jgi:hypothetical protein
MTVFVLLLLRRSSSNKIELMTGDRKYRLIAPKPPPPPTPMPQPKITIM